MSTLAYARQHKLLGLCRSCTKPVVEGSTTYCEYHREQGRIRGRNNSKKSIIKFKNECLEAYGKKCICCGETVTAFLTLDHERGKGNEHRKSLFIHNVGGLHMYRWLKKNNYPSGYRILCMNCNWATRYNPICPHRETSDSG